MFALRILRSSAGRSGIRLRGTTALSSSVGIGSLGRRAGIQVSLVLIDGPVEDIVVLEALTDEEITEDLTEVAVVRLVVETERTSVVKVNGELVREATAKNLGRGGHLLLHDAVVLLLLGSSLQTLPGKRTAAEVKHDVTKRFHVITSRLF